MTALTIPEKECKKCKDHVWYKRKTGDFVCKTCSNRIAREWVINNRDRHNKNMLKYRNTPVGRLALNRARQKERDNLTDNYIRQSIYLTIYNSTGEKIDRSQITQEQIERYRENIKAVRKLKQVINNQSKQEEVMKTNTPELTKAKMSNSMKEMWRKRKAEKLTDQSIATLAAESVAGLTEAELKTKLHSEKMKKSWEKRRAATAVPATVSSPVGAIETLLNDLKNIATKKQEILNHLEAIKQLINQL